MWPRVLNLTATGVSDPDGSVTAVAFYRENNAKPGLQTGTVGDAFVGNASPAGGSTWAYSADVTSWQAGHPTLYAIATDNQNATSAGGVSAPSAQAGILPLGDANGDYTVDGTDYSQIDHGYASHGSLTGWANGDFNNDGKIDGSDYALIDNAYNTQGSLSAAEVNAAPAGAIARKPVRISPPDIAGLSSDSGNREISSSLWHSFIGADDDSWPALLKKAVRRATR